MSAPADISTGIPELSSVEPTDDDGVVFDLGIAELDQKDQVESLASKMRVNLENRDQEKDAQTNRLAAKSALPTQMLEVLSPGKLKAIEKMPSPEQMFLDDSKLPGWLNAGSRSGVLEQNPDMYEEARGIYGAYLDWSRPARWGIGLQQAQEENAHTGNRMAMEAYFKGEQPSDELRAEVIANQQKMGGLQRDPFESFNSFMQAGVVGQAQFADMSMPERENLEAPFKLYAESLPEDSLQRKAIEWATESGAIDKMGTAAYLLAAGATGGLNSPLVHGNVIIEGFQLEMGNAVTTLSQFTDEDGNYLDPDTVVQAAMAYGAFATTIEYAWWLALKTGVVGQAAGLKQNFKQLVMGRTAKTLQNATVKRALGKLLKGIGFAAAGGTAEEGVQAGGEILIQLLAKHAQGNFKDSNTWDDVFDSFLSKETWLAMYEEGKHGSFGAIGVGGGPTVVAGIGDLAVAQQAKKNAEAYKGLAEKIAPSELKRRGAGPQLEMMMRRAEDPENADSVYFDPEDITDVLNQAGVDPEEVHIGLTAEIERARDERRNVKVPSAEYAVNLAGSTLFNEMNNIIMFKATGDFSAKRVVELDAELEGLAKATYADLESPDKVAFDKSLKHVRHVYTKQLADSGLWDVSEISKQATQVEEIFRGLALTLTRSQGRLVTPEEANRIRPLQVLGPNGAAPVGEGAARVMEQGDFRSASIMVDGVQYEGNTHGDAYDAALAAGAFADITDAKSLEEIDTEDDAITRLFDDIGMRYMVEEGFTDEDGEFFEREDAMIGRSEDQGFDVEPGEVLNQDEIPSAPVAREDQRGPVAEWVRPPEIDPDITPEQHLERITEAVDPAMIKWVPSKTKDGKLRGVPENVNSIRDWNRLQKFIERLVQEGLVGRYWYEESAIQVLKEANGDFPTAKKLIQLLAIYSPQANVPVNTMLAVKAFNLWKSGVSREDFIKRVSSEMKDAKAVAVLYDNEGFVGRKIDSFSKNLMYQLIQIATPEQLASMDLDEAVLGELAKPVTSDMWVFRAYGYATIVGSNDKGLGRYSTTENALTSIAAKLNANLPVGADPWLPHQVQAAMWTGIKGHYETDWARDRTNADSLRLGHSYMATKKGETKAKLYRATGKDKKTGIPHADSHEALWRKYALKVPQEIVDETIAREAASFADVLERMTYSVPFEAEPSPAFNSPLQNAPRWVKRNFQDESVSLIIDPLDGHDKVAAMAGAPIAWRVNSWGGYESFIAANTVSNLTPTKPAGDYQASPEVQLYTEMIRYIYKQDAVPWFRPDVKADLTKSYRTVRDDGETSSWFSNQREADQAATEYNEALKYDRLDVVELSDGTFKTVRAEGDTTQVYETEAEAQAAADLNNTTLKNEPVTVVKKGARSFETVYADGTTAKKYTTQEKADKAAKSNNSAKLYKQLKVVELSDGTFKTVLKSGRSAKPFTTIEQAQAAADESNSIKKNEKQLRVEGTEYSHGVDFVFENDISEIELEDFYELLREELGEHVGFTKRGRRVTVINFRFDDNLPKLDDEKFAELTDKIGDNHEGIEGRVRFGSQTEYDEFERWSEDHTGEGLLLTGRLAGRRDLHPWLRAYRAKAEEVLRDYESLVTGRDRQPEESGIFGTDRSPGERGLRRRLERENHRRLGLLRDDGAPINLLDLHLGKKVDVSTQRAVYRALNMDVDPDADTSDLLKIYPLQEVFGTTVEETMAVLQPWLDEIGWKFKIFGEKNGDRPAYFPDFQDPLTPSYKDKVAWIYDPELEEGSFSDHSYTLAWRVVHEIAHGITNNALTEKYKGRGRRAGAMGVNLRGPFWKGAPTLTLADAQRAVEWEHQTFIEQRRIFEDVFGIEITEEQFNKENSINLSDAVYRAMTGQFGNSTNIGVAPTDLDSKQLLRTSLHLLAEISYEINGDTNEELVGQPIILDQPVFHGGRVDHDGFSFDFVGTGEGTQAYGFGIYFSSSRGIAEFYRKSLVRPSGPGIRPENIKMPNEIRPDLRSEIITTVNGLFAHSNYQSVPDPADVLQRVRDKLAGRLDTFRAELVSLKNNELIDGMTEAEIVEEISGIEDAVAQANALTADELSFKSPKENGQLFEADIPEDSELMDWSAPLSEQPEYVKNQLLSIVDGEQSDAFRREFDRDTIFTNKRITGQKLYRAMTNIYGSARKVSEALAGAGIKGHKYPSREMREGSGDARNFVIYDPEAIEIIQKFYQPSLPPAQDLPDGDPFTAENRLDIPANIDERTALNIKLAEGKTSVALTRAKGSRQFFRIIHSSTRQPGRWQMSFFSDRRAEGHVTFDTKEEALREAAIEGFRVDNRDELFQPDGASSPNETSRAQYWTTAKSSYIQLTEASDLTSFGHELAHFYLDTVQMFVDEGLADETMTRDLETIYKFLEISDPSQLKQPYADGRLAPDGKTVDIPHEVWARGFEKFMAEGVAPSRRLAGAFARFHTWVMATYKSVERIAQALGVELNPEIREVYGRMMGAEQTVDSIPDMALFKTQEEGQMSDAAWRTYRENQDLVRQEARSKIVAPEYAALKRERTQARRDLRAALVEKYTEEVDAEKLYTAMRILAEGDAELRIENLGGISRDAIRELYADEPGKADFAIKALGRKLVATEGGHDPIVAAQLYGFPNAKKMISMMGQADRKAEIKRRVERELASREDEIGLAPERLDADAGSLIGGEELERQLRNEIRELKRLANKDLTPAVKRAVAEVGAPSAKASRSRVEQAQAALDEAQAGGNREAIAQAQDELATATVAQGVERDARRAQNAAVRKIKEVEALLDSHVISNRAARVVWNRPSGDIASDRSHWARALPKIHARARKAVAARDYLGAIQAMEEAALHAAMISEADRAIANQPKALDYAKTFDKESKREKLRAAGESTTLDLIDAIRDKIDFRRTAPIDPALTGPARTAAIAKRRAESANRRAASRDVRENFVRRLLEWTTWKEENYEVPELDLSVLEREGEIHWKELTVSEFEGVYASLKNMEKLARGKSAEIRAGEKKTVDEMAEKTVAALLAKNPDRKARDESKEEDSYWNRRRKNWEAWDALHIKMPRLFRWMGGDDFDANPLLQIADMWKNSATMEHLLYSKYSEAYNEILEELFLNDLKYSERIELPGIDSKTKKRTRISLIGFALNLGTQSNYDKTRDGYKLTDAQMETIAKMLTDDEWVAVQRVWDLLDSLWEPSQKHHFDLTGNKVPGLERRQFVTATGRVMEGGYVPMSYEHDSDSFQQRLEDNRDISDMTKTYAGRPDTRQDWFNKRNDKYSAKVQLDLTVIGTHLRDVIHDLAWRKNLKFSWQVLHRQEVRDAIVGKYGKEYFDAIEHRMRMFGGKVVDPNKNFSTMKGWAATAVTNYTAYALSGAVSTTFVQPAGLAVGVPYIDPGHRTRSTAMLAAKLAEVGNPSKWSETKEFIFEQSPWMRERAEQLDYSIAQQLKKLEGRTDLIARGRLAGYKLIGYSDYLTSAPIWLARYEVVMDKTGDKAEAVREADYAVDASQGSGNVDSLAQIQDSSDGMRAFGMFYSFFSAYYNALHRLGEKLSDKSLPASQRYGGTLMDYILISTVTNVLSDLLKFKGLPEDEDDDGELWDDYLLYGVETTLLSPLQSMLFVRDLASFGWNQATGRGFGRLGITPISSMPEAMFKVIKDAVDIVNPEEEFEWMDEGIGTASDVVKAFGMARGAAFTRQTAQIMDNIQRAYDQEEPLSIFDFLRRRKKKD